MHLDFNRRWIPAAIPNARLMVVRLTATEPSRVAHLAQREIGSGADEQAQRLLRQAAAKGSIKTSILPGTDDRK